MENENTNTKEKKENILWEYIGRIKPWASIQFIVWFLVLLLAAGIEPTNAIELNTLLYVFILATCAERLTNIRFLRPKWEE